MQTEYQTLLAKLDQMAAQLAYVTARQRAAEDMIAELVPVVKEALNTAIARFAIFEQKGYFAFAQSVMGVGQRIVEGFSPRDVNQLGDAIVSIFITVRVFTNPICCAWPQMPVPPSTKVTSSSHLACLAWCAPPKMKTCKKAWRSCLKCCAELATVLAPWPEQKPAPTAMPNFRSSWVHAVAKRPSVSNALCPAEAAKVAKSAVKASAERATVAAARTPAAARPSPRCQVQSSTELPIRPTAT